MAVLLYGVEVEILTGLESPDRADFLPEAARAYRARGKCLEALGREKAARADRKRADDLEADATKLTSTPPKGKATATAPVQVVNGWTEPVTLVIEGVSYRLEVGEQRAISLSGSSAGYELQAGPYRKAGTVEAGKAYTIRITAP
jgi:hypothetical protein